MATIIQSQIEALQKLEIDFKQFLQDLLDAGFDERQIKRLVSQLLTDIETERPPITMIGVLKDDECKCTHVSSVKDGYGKGELFATKGCPLHEKQSEIIVKLDSVQERQSPISEFDVQHGTTLTCRECGGEYPTHGNTCSRKQLPATETLASKETEFKV